MPFGTFMISRYKANLDAKLVANISIGKFLEIRASTGHATGISGTIYFKGDLAQGAVGSFTKSPDPTFKATLPETYFESVYAIVSTEKPVYIRYFADQTFEEASYGATVDIKGLRIQTDNEDIGEGVDAS